METASAIDWPTLIMVLLALFTALTAVVFGYLFSKAIGGELGAAFKWVMGGTLLFALTRADDVLKVAGVFAKMGINYQKQVWLPHSVAVALAWLLITYGFFRMYKTFSA
ncbi:MAG TPA: hypothetical protein VFF06_31930 [Polyangia bacterium]|nr:hypothetical protein [Polyangia bacterium]